MRNFKKFGINNLRVATFLLFLIPIASSPVIASPDQFISMVGEEAINALADKKVSNQMRKTRFRKLLNRAFEVKFIALKSQHIRKLSPNPAVTTRGRQHLTEYELLKIFVFEHRKNRQRYIYGYIPMGVPPIQ